MVGSKGEKQDGEGTTARPTASAACWAALAAQSEAECENAPSRSASESVDRASRLARVKIDAAITKTPLEIG